MDKQIHAGQMKTPNDMTITNVNKSALPRTQSFKKSLHFDSGLTPNGEQTNAKTTTNGNDVNEQRSKAKTSLQFSGPLFSAKSFYGRKDEPNDMLGQTTYMLSKRMPLPYVQINEKKPKPKKSKKSSLLKGPVLWKHGGAIRKMRQRAIRSAKQQKKKKKKVTERRRRSNPDDVENVDPTVVKRRKLEDDASKEKNKSLQSLFNDHMGDVSRPIDWVNPTGSSSNADASKLCNDNSDDDDSDSEEDGVDVRDIALTELNNHGVSNEDEGAASPSNRKFFKSSKSTAKKYQIIGGINAMLKRGGNIRLERPPKRKKKPKRKDTALLHNSISGIINRLSSPSKVPPMDASTSDPIESTSTENMDVQTDKPSDDRMQYEKYAKMLPYQTDDPVKMRQQESTLQMLISNRICNDETFKIFIAEPDMHKAKAKRILDAVSPSEQHDKFSDKRVPSLQSLTSESTSPGSKSTSISSGLDQMDGGMPVAKTTMDDDVTDAMPMSPASQISDMTLSLAIRKYTLAKTKINVIF